VRVLPLLVLPLFLLGCPAAEPIPFCEGPNQVRFGLDSFELWPDDRWTIEADTPTGRRLDIDPESDAVAGFPLEWRSLFSDLSTLDGWGINAAAVLQFPRAVDPPSVEGAVRLIAEGPAGWEAIPTELRFAEFDRTVYVRPRVPLPFAASAALVVTVDATDADGTCLSPPPPLRELLTPSEDPLGLRYAAALELLGLAPEDVAAMTVFTTQSVRPDSQAVAQDVAGRTYAPEPGACAELGDGRWRCDSAVELQDYRDAEGHVAPDFDGTPVSTYRMPFSVWYPGAPADGPYPVVLSGHGLNSDRFESDRWSRALRDLGVAVVGNPAIAHGEHPLRGNDGGDLVGLLRFFGLGPGSFVLDPLRLRDNFRQSAWDRLQIAEAMTANPDLDGDGVGEFLPPPFGYAGASLGAMMGTELTALSPHIDGAALSVGGGRFEDIVLYGDPWSALLAAYVPPDYQQADLERSFELFQTLADAGDPMSWGRAFAAQPAKDGPAPQVLLQFAHLDDTVNNVANSNHGQAFGVPLLGREIWPMPAIEHAEGPLSGNLPGGGSGAVQLFDTRTDASSPGQNPQPATHGNLPHSYEAQRDVHELLRAVFDERPAVFDDPDRPAE
jgi:hypothetical protein